MNRSSTLFIAAAIACAAGATPASATALFGLSFSTDLTGSTYSIVTFDSNSTGVETSRRTITGLGGASLFGLDLRPANNTLYALAGNRTVYQLALTGSTYTATAITTLGGPAFAAGTTDFGFDFNPTVDRVRIITNAGQNYRLTVGGANNGTTNTDGAITVNGSPNASIVGSAYTNNRAGATTTLLYGIDTVTDSLVVTTNPNGGVYTTVGSGLGIPAGITNFNDIGFDISGVDGLAFLNVDAMLYSVNLATGVASQLGTIGSGQLVDITAAGVVPEPASWAMMIGGVGLVGGTLRRRARPARTRATA